MLSETYNHVTAVAWVPLIVWPVIASCLSSKRVVLFVRIVLRSAHKVICTFLLRHYAKCKESDVVDKATTKVAIKSPPTRVRFFWDIQNCRYNPNKSRGVDILHALWQQFGYGTVIVACTEADYALFSELIGVPKVTVHLVEEHKNAADAALIVEMGAFMRQCTKTQSRAVLISGDGDFAPMMHMLSAFNCSTHLVYSARHVSDSLLLLADSSHCWKELLNTVPSRQLQTSTTVPRLSSLSPTVTTLRELSRQVACNQQRKTTSNCWLRTPPELLSWREKEARVRIRKNIVVVGLPELEPPVPLLIEKEDRRNEAKNLELMRVRAWARALSVKTHRITEVYRVGDQGLFKPRDLKIKFADTKAKEEMMRNVNKLRTLYAFPKDVQLRDDMTHMQLREYTLNDVYESVLSSPTFMLA